jgi:hypothetical protein
MNRNQIKRHIKNFHMNVMAASLSIGCAMVLAANAAPANQSDKTNGAPRSVFILPSNPKEGRDPFFPDSTRPYEIAAAANPQVADITSLVLRGFSGLMDHRLVIINNHTFSAGDEGDVITSTGRIHLTCIEIKTNSVVIEVGGQRRELFYLSKP